MTDADKDKIVAKLQYFYDSMISMETDIQAFSMYVDDNEERNNGKQQIIAIEKLLKEYKELFERYLHV